MGLYKAEAVLASGNKKYMFRTLVEAEAFIEAAKGINWRKFKNGDIVIFSSDANGKYVSERNFSKEVEELINDNN